MGITQNIFSVYLFCCFLKPIETTVLMGFKSFFKNKFVVFLHPVIRCASVMRSVSTVKVLIVHSKKSIALL
jgi:hypothetical protein